MDAAAKAGEMDGGTWLTYLLLAMLIASVMMASYWLIDFIFDGIKGHLIRRHEQQMQRWAKIRELEKELDEHRGD